MFVTSSTKVEESSDTGYTLTYTENHKTRIAVGTIVSGRENNGTSTQLLTFAELNQIFGVTDCSKENTAVFASNGDGAAQNVHIDGCVCMEEASAWYAAYAGNKGNGYFRHNFVAFYFGEQ